MKELKEELAAQAHYAWSYWMKYMFSKCIDHGPTADMQIPKELVERWKRQMNTEYKDLSEEERKSI